MNQFLFPHMPKTGGSSILYALNSQSELNITECYASPLKAEGNIIKKLRNKLVCRGLTSREVFLYGHFGLGDISFKKLKKCRTIMFFREPIDWLGSYLFYVEKKHGTFISDIEKFILVNRLDRCYELFLGPYSPINLNFIGIFEEYERSITNLSSFLNLELQVEHRNVTERPSRPYRDLLSSRFDFDIIVNAMERNFAIYREALFCFEKNKIGS